MGHGISTRAYGPDEVIAKKALVATLRASGYRVSNETDEFIFIQRYGTYKYVTESCGPDVVRATITWQYHN
jgi:hypothetical protein